MKKKKKKNVLTGFLVSQTELPAIVFEFCVKTYFPTTLKKLKKEN